jgi:hypothetical protein
MIKLKKIKNWSKKNKVNKKPKLETLNKQT